MGKRAAAGSGNLRKRPNGTWEARYIVGVDSATGKSIRKSVYGKTQKEVREKLRAAVAAIDVGEYFEPSKMTVGQWLDEWLLTYTGDLKPLTLDSYRRHIENNIKPHIGGVRLSSLTAPIIQRLYNNLQSGADKAPLSAKTIKNLHGVLHKALKQAVMVGYIKTNPADAVTVPRVQKKEIQPLEGGSIVAFMDAVQNEKYRLVYLVDLYTGMRQGEILGLTWDCVDFQNNTIHIKRQLQKQKNAGGRFYFAPLKNGKSRSVKVAPAVMRYLCEQKVAQSQTRLIAGELWDNSGGVYTDDTCSELSTEPNLVFTNELGGHLVGGTVYKRFKAIARNIGIPTARFHDLRHSFAVASLENGDDIKTVQSNLGHATASFTLDVYGHVSERMAQDSADRMEAYIMRVSKNTSKG